MDRWFKTKIQNQDVMVYEGRPKKWYRGYKYHYHMRHGDSDMSIPSTVESYVLVNHWGVCCSKKKIKMKDIGINPYKCNVYELLECEKDVIGRILSRG